MPDFRRTSTLCDSDIPKFNSRRWSNGSIAKVGTSACGESRLRTNELFVEKSIYENTAAVHGSRRGAWPVGGGGVIWPGSTGTCSAESGWIGCSWEPSSTRSIFSSVCGGGGCTDVRVLPSWSAVGVSAEWLLLAHVVVVARELLTTTYWMLRHAH